MIKNVFHLIVCAVSAITENSPVSGASLNKAEIFFGYFDILVIPNEFWKGTGTAPRGGLKYRKKCRVSGPIFSD